MARTILPIRKTYAVFLRTRRKGRTILKREQYNIVTLDYGEGEKSYVEPVCGRPLSSAETEELYDDVKFFEENERPFAKTMVGE